MAKRRRRGSPRTQHGVLGTLIAVIAAAAGFVARGKGRAETALSGVEPAAELLLHLLAGPVEPPAEGQHQHQNQKNQSHDEIEYEECNTFEYRRGCDSQKQNDERRERIAPHEAHHRVDDRHQEVHVFSGFQVFKPSPQRACKPHAGEFIFAKVAKIMRNSIKCRKFGARKQISSQIC